MQKPQYWQKTNENRIQRARAVGWPAGDRRLDRRRCCVVPNVACDVNFMQPDDPKHLPANAGENVLDETVNGGLGVKGDRRRVKLAVNVHAS